MSHGNASLTPTGWLRLARCVVDDGWPLRRATERFGVSVTTAQRWSGRYREQGHAGMGDRSSRPHRCPRQLPARIEHRIRGAVLACGTVVVGVCLVYLGVHWATDVLAGWALGAALGAGAGLLCRSGPWIAAPRRAHDRS